MVTISFPGLGIEPFEINRVIFSIGDIEIRWYSLCLTFGILLALFYAGYRAKQEGIDSNDTLDIALFTIPLAIVGARTYYVLTTLGEYDSFLDMIAIWNGGIAIYGAIIAGGLTILAVCRYKKIPFLKMFDATAPAVMIGQILGRWGNFFNGEAYGREILEGSPLYFIRMGLIPNVESYSQMHYFHPTFLYESLWNRIGFLIIHFLYKKKKFDGQIFFMYITWYGFGRMLIEGLRTDSLYVGVFRISQVVGFLCFVTGAIVLIIKLIRVRRQALTAATTYVPTYEKLSHMQTYDATEAEQSEEDIESEEKTPETEKETEENEE